MQDIILTAWQYVTSATNDMVLYILFKPLNDILLNKSLARILIRSPTSNEHEPFYLM